MDTRRGGQASRAEAPLRSLSTRADARAKVINKLLQCHQVDASLTSYCSSCTSVPGSCFRGRFYLLLPSLRVNDAERDDFGLVCLDCPVVLSEMDNNLVETVFGNAML